MTTVKFDKAVKYRGVRYAAHETFKVDDSDVDQLKSAGATVLAVETVPSPDSESEPDGDGEDSAQLKEELLKYTAPQLVEFAKERGIDLLGKTRKADVYNIIVTTLD